MIATPAISVIMPAYNVGPFIGVALHSVLVQSLPDWELLVVDDGSTDGTADIVAAFPDPRIRLIRQENAGVSAARGRAMAAACGGAMLFLDADDWLAPDALARLSAALGGAPRAVAACGPAVPMAESARPGDAPLRAPRPCPGGDLLETLLVRNLFANGGQVLVRREAIAATGSFRTELRYGEDWEYWTRLALHGPFAALQGSAPVLFVRERQGSAYRRMASDPAAFAPAMQAIFGNPALPARLGPARLERLRWRAEAENGWIVARERLRHGRRAEGLAGLRRAFRAAPSVRRAVLLAAAHALPLLPARLHGPFAAYPAG